jgi:2,3-bisphosphoglycerate-dependent phosphoglycerate mutase
MGDMEGRVWGDFQGLLVSASGERKEIREPESPKAVTERAMAWWNETIVGTTASCVLMVSHGGWIRLLVQGLLGGNAIRAARGVTVGRCPNTGMSVVEIPRERGRGKLLQYGKIVHLRGQVDVVENNADERGITPAPRNVI